MCTTNFDFSETHLIHLHCHIDADPFSGEVDHLWVLRDPARNQTKADCSMPPLAWAKERRRTAAGEGHGLGKEVVLPLWNTHGPVRATNTLHRNPQCWRP